MFNEMHQDPLWIEKINLAFAKSKNVKVYPSGRRRTPEGFDLDNNNTISTDEKYRIPFDPEARLNTEANNRKLSSLNGFTQTYLKDWSTSGLELALGGYLFTLTFDEGSLLLQESDRNSAIRNEFGTAIINTLKDTDAKEIYANVLLEEVQLISSAVVGDYFTEILRNQSSTEWAEESLDLLTDSALKTVDIQIMKSTESFYFSGLSFSTTPLSTLQDGESMIILPTDDSNAKAKKRVISLCILKRESTDANWEICETARLPKITHGRTPDSVKVHELVSDAMSVEEFSAYNSTVTNHSKTKTLEVIESIKAASAELTGDFSADNISANSVNADSAAIGTLSVNKVKQSNRPVPYITISADNQLQIWFDGSDSRIN